MRSSKEHSSKEHRSALQSRQERAEKLPFSSLAHTLQVVPCTGRWAFATRSGVLSICIPVHSGTLCAFELAILSVCTQAKGMHSMHTEILCTVYAEHAHRMRSSQLFAGKVNRHTKWRMRRMQTDRTERAVNLTVCEPLS